MKTFALLTRTGLDWSHRYGARSMPCYGSRSNPLISTASCALSTRISQMNH
jgi:hypothetical protein